MQSTLFSYGVNKIKVIKSIFILNVWKSNALKCGHVFSETLFHLYFNLKKDVSLYWVIVLLNAIIHTHSS